MIEAEYNNARNHLLNDLQLMLFVLPDDDEKRYRAIKYTTDTIIGVPSQCVQLDKVYKTSKQYCANVALKINLKLGGTNQSLEETEIPQLTKEPVMLLGADVTHPTGGRAGPSSTQFQFLLYYSFIKNLSIILNIISILQICLQSVQLLVLLIVKAEGLSLNLKVKEQDKKRLKIWVVWLKKF